MRFTRKKRTKEILLTSRSWRQCCFCCRTALACNIEDDFLMRIANLAGGLVCEKVGVTPIQREDLLKANLV